MVIWRSRYCTARIRADLQEIHSSLEYVTNSSPVQVFSKIFTCTSKVTLSNNGTVLVKMAFPSKLKDLK